MKVGGDSCRISFSQILIVDLSGIFLQRTVFLGCFSPASERFRWKVSVKKCQILENIHSSLVFC